MTVPTELPPAVFPEALPPSARAWLCVVEAGGKVRRWSVGDVDGWRERFFLGSVAKLVAALVVQALEQQGQVALDRPLLETHSVTLRCLLRHTAGLPDVWPLFACDLAQALSLSLWPPGTAFSYSNLGFVVLGDWLAQHTGQPLSALAARYVFTPYGMAQASLCDALPGAAGGLTATGEDVAQLLTRLLSTPGTTQMPGSVSHPDTGPHWDGSRAGVFPAHLRRKDLAD
ncbi:MAG: serine hydrolase domain-containing protein [Acidobacteriota bacterium]